MKQRAGKTRHTVRFTIEGVEGVQEETYRSWTDVVVRSTFRLRHKNILHKVTIISIEVGGRIRRPDGGWQDVGKTGDHLR